jgi:hypothetical protein
MGVAMLYHMVDLRKILIIAIIAVLLVVLSFALTSSIYENPKYEDYCDYRQYEPVPAKMGYAPGNCTAIVPDQQLMKDCSAQGGYVQPVYDTNGCQASETCNTCDKRYQDAKKVYDMYVFIVFSIIGLIAIIAGLQLGPEKNELNKWVGTGFITGGLSTIFVGTGFYYNDMLRFYRPIVIAIEIAIVIYVFYREMGMYQRMVAMNASEGKKAKK